MVPLAGLEPARSLLRGILSPLRLPIPPQRRVFCIFIQFFTARRILSPLRLPIPPHERIFNCVKLYYQTEKKKSSKRTGKLKFRKIFRFPRLHGKIFCDKINGMEELNNEETADYSLSPNTENPEQASEITTGQPAEQPQKKSGMQQFIEILKFTGFSISAGVIQLVSDGILCDWTGWLPWWPAYLISVVLSVIWNFTFNRKFTFKAANNVPLAMCLVLVYYCAFIPLSVFGGNAIAAQLPENLGLLVTFMMMLINFVTEFVWDKFIVFNQKVTDRILNLFKKK